jgi:hypothetical protein
MKFLSLLALSAALTALLSFVPSKESVPQIGLVAPLDQDSLVHAAGFRMLGETVSRMVSPALSEDQFKRNLARIKKAQCKVYLCNILFTGKNKNCRAWSG